jgi:hypothetical protein
MFRNQATDWGPQNSDVETFRKHRYFIHSVQNNVPVNRAGFSGMHSIGAFCVDLRYLRQCSIRTLNHYSFVA